MLGNGLVHSVLGSRFLISMYTLSFQGNVFANKHVPMDMIGAKIKRAVLSAWSVPRRYERDEIRAESVESCKCGFDYLQRSPSSRRRRRKWNPVLGRIAGAPCSWGMYDYIRGPAPSGWRSPESETVKCGRSPAGLGSDNDCPVEAQQQL
jgi:hypothetical protein